MQVLGEIQFKGKTLLVVEHGPGVYVNGVFSRLLLVPPSSIDRNIPDLVEVVKENVKETST